ncbi:E3 ubiquitin-protein ligase MARCHF3-like [Porites lutea]|uniref:E3 ubiquitin-protein ligase MARCHF3-like n=1 Tax=Porites lutea TaxID=51062 RepID=UPI003CC6D1BA
MTENEPIMERQKGFAIVEHRVSPVSNADQSLQNFNLDIDESSSDDLLNTCRICRDETVRESLISPCHCAGTLGKCHLQCLEEWLSKANKSSCEICGHRYHTARIPRSFKEWIIKGQSRRERRYLLADLICFLILGPLVIASSYLCAQGAWYYLVFAVDKWTGTGLVILSLFLWCIFGFWLIVTIRYHRRCWLDWKNHNHVVKLVKISRFEDGVLDDPQGSCSAIETAV